MNICLCDMTIEKIHAFFSDFQYDPSIFENPDDCKPYSYDPAAAEAFFDKHRKADRVHFAVMLGDDVIGDLYLKHIDNAVKTCTLSIHMKNDSVKNRGYGTTAEILAIEYAFGVLQLETVFADTLTANARSRHVLEKVGFVMTHTDERFCYYRCDRAVWNRPEYVEAGTVRPV